MEDGMTLSKQGLTFCRWNSDRCGMHKRRRKDGKCVIVNRESGEIAFTADSPEEADEFFYDTGTVTNIFSALRNRITLEPGVTLRDLMRTIESYEELELLTLAVLPLFDYQRQIDDYSFTPTGALIIGREGLVVDDTLNIVPRNSISIPHANFDVALELDESFCVYDNGQVVFRGSLCFSLLELLENLFGKHPDEISEVYLSQTGLTESSGDSADPLQHLMSRCVVGDNFSLKHLFDFVDSNEILKLFIAQYSWCGSIDEFHAAARNTPEPTTLKFLKINKNGDVHEYKGERDITICYDIYGYGPLSEEEKEDWNKYTTLDGDGNPKPPPTCQRYGIEFSPMNELADLSIVIDNIFEIHEYKNDFPIIFSSKPSFTLLEILDAVYWEISFCGSPADAKEMLDGLKKQVDEIEEGTAKTTPIDDLLENTKKENGYQKDIGEPDEPYKPKQYLSVDEMRAELDEDYEYRIDIEDPRED